MRPLYQGVSWARSQGNIWKFYQNQMIRISSCHYFQKRLFAGVIRHYKARLKPLFCSTILHQEGNLLLEMPCIVQVVNGGFEITSNDKIGPGKIFSGLGIEYLPEPKAKSQVVDSSKEMKMMHHLFDCQTLQELCHHLSLIPEEEVTPSVALHAIKLILELKENFSFARSAMLKHLVETICNNGSPSIILKSLQVLLLDYHKLKSDNSYNYGKLLCTECIILATEGKFNLEQICQMIKDFHALGDIAAEYIDSAWVGINKKSIQKEDLAMIASILPFVNSSRPYLYNLFEKQFASMLTELKDTNISEIISSLEIKGLLENRELLPLISKWMAFSSNKYSEKCFSDIMTFFTFFQYTDECVQCEITTFLEGRYIKDPSVLVTLSQYLTKMRIRDQTLLQIIADYFMLRPRSTKAHHVLDLTRCFASLNFIPDHYRGFRNVWESVINRKCDELSISEVLELSLYCLYLECSPLVSINRRLYSGSSVKIVDNDDEKDLPVSLVSKDIENIMIVNTLLKIDYPDYKGFDIPEDLFSTVIKRDDKIEPFLTKLKPFIQDIANGDVQELVHLPLPAVRLFEIDFVVTINPLIPDSDFTEPQKLALLINFPEDLDITGKFLMGHSALKKKIIETLSYEVVCLKYSTINSLFCYPEKLKEYLREKLLNA